MSNGSLGSRPDVANKKTPSGKEKQRSRTGCRTCRSRKAKCDERPGGCRNCERLNIQCPNSPAYLTPPEGGGIQGDGDVDGGLVRTQAGLRRSRTYRSCKSCRSSKSRCTGERPTCLRCIQRKLDCVYDGKQVPAWVETVSNGLEPRRHARSLTPGSSGTESVWRDSSNFPDFDGSSFTGSPRHAASVVVVGGLGWLTSTELPDKDRVILLIEEYFVNVHSLRSFGFIHRPSFMQQLDDRLRLRRKSDMLLYTLCTLGAKFYALRCDVAAQLAEGFTLNAGSQWAERALNMLFTNMNNVSVESTMAVVLLHEHELRIGNYASAFTLTGIAVRMVQALQINLESSSDVLCLEKKA